MFISLSSSSLYKAPWARVLVYGLGHKVRRNGQLSLMEAVCYPLDASPSNTGLTPPPTTHQYPSIVIPTDKVHIKLGECTTSSRSHTHTDTPINTDTHRHTLTNLSFESNKEDDDNIPEPNFCVKGYCIRNSPTSTSCNSARDKSEMLKTCFCVVVCQVFRLLLARCWYCTRCLWSFRWPWPSRSSC